MKIGIYVDAANINKNGGYAMRYDVLKDYCARDLIPIRLNTYTVFDRDRSETDREYRDKQYSYFAVLRSFGYKVITKPLRWFTDDEGNRYGKANADLDMAVDILTQARHLDKIFILTGDGDFKKVVQAVQNMGVRVEIIAFKNISRELVFEADLFTSGYLIPNLLPIDHQDQREWGMVDSKVRGSCYAIQDGFGFMRIINQSYEFEEVFFHFSELPPGHRVRLDEIFEFSLHRTAKGWQAKSLRAV